MDKTCYNILALLIVLFQLLVSSLAKTSTNITTDESALLDFKAQLVTSDILARNWSNSSSVCSWIGVTCGVRHHRVISLNLSRIGLVGTISPQLGNLSFLAVLALGFNDINGTLPQELSNLRRLKFLSIKNNNLVGEIPSWFGGLSRLEHLDFSNNSFTGSIPKHLSNLTNLKTLIFSFNSIDGEIPQELGRLHNLQLINMEGNHLSGAIPSSLFNISTLKTIALTFNELNGSLPNELCKNLPFIEEIYLGLNKLSGHIPSNLSQCSHLTLLSLASNLFNGGIPATIGDLTSLQALALGGNNLNGITLILMTVIIMTFTRFSIFKVACEFLTKRIQKSCLSMDRSHTTGDLQSSEKLMLLSLGNNQISGGLPTNIFNISSLQTLYLHHNELVGNLPSQLNNLTSLEDLIVSYNNFTGDLPRGFMGQLENLGFGLNMFTGIIPPELFNISSLLVLELTGNSLHGALPTNMCYSNSFLLQKLFTDENNLTGVIPASLSNCSHLYILELSYNKFTGFLQPHLIRSLPFLQQLQLSGNNLRIELSSFIDSLTSCTSLIGLGIGENTVYGIIPSSIGNLSSSLQQLYLYRCEIKGSIPPQIGNLSSLITLSLFSNELSGHIQPAVKHLTKLQALSLYNNSFKGPIPEAICDLTSLTILNLARNQLSGPIPECFVNLTSLRYLYLYSNKLSSNIPSSLWHLKDLLYLYMYENNLNGSLPLEIGSLSAILILNLSGNQLSNTLPSTIGDLKNLMYLSLAQNRLEGYIPLSLGSMITLESLDLSHNNLSGFIPKSLELLQYLKYLNVSFNDLSGEIPTGDPFRNFTMESFMGNKGLCGAPRFNVSHCPSATNHRFKKKKVELALFVVAGVFVIFAIFCLERYRGKENRASGVHELASVDRKRISYYEILQATDQFGESNLLGLGSFGSVYKGVFRDGETVAVKVFNLQSEAALRSFDVECEILRNIRHRNLIKVISSCSNLDFKALVLEYMPKGSLDKWLYSHNYCLDVMQRLNIMIDVASALEYLHHGYSTPIVHCDLKPSNVLLDDEMIGHVSDFGVAKLFANEESNVITSTLATFGYIAPEYGLEGLVSTKCDVYSYGIMLMETFTRKRPSDDMFAGDLSLSSWVESSFLDSLDEVIDENLLNLEEGQLEKKMKCVFSVLKLALKCSAESPRDRINMKEALVELLKIKHEFSQRTTS